MSNKIGIAHYCRHWPALGALTACGAVLDNVEHFWYTNPTSRIEGYLTCKTCLALANEMPNEISPNKKEIAHFFPSKPGEYPKVMKGTPAPCGAIIDNTTGHYWTTTLPISGFVTCQTCIDLADNKSLTKALLANDPVMNEPHEVEEINKAVAKLTTNLKQSWANEKKHLKTIKELNARINELEQQVALLNTSKTELLSKLQAIEVEFAPYKMLKNIQNNTELDGTEKRFKLLEID